MPRRNNRDKEVPQLCAAVKRVREAYGDTLAQFSQRIGVSINSISRFELGKATPGDQRVLMMLYRAALGKGLLEESEQFFEASSPLVAQIAREQAPQNAWSAVRGLSEWRRLTAVSITQELFTEHLPAVDKALSPALELVDTVLTAIDDFAEVDYGELKHRIRQLADQQVLMQIQQQRKNQCATK